MRTKPAIILLIGLSAVVVGLAWEFRPRGESQGANLTPAVSSTLKLSGTASVPPAVEAPKAPAVNPATVVADKTKPDRAAITAAGGSIEPVALTYVNNQPTMDFGEVVLTPGVPVHLVMPTGQTGTMTANRTLDGRLQVDVDIQGVAPGGQANMVHGVAFGDSKGITNASFGNGEINIIYSVKLSGN